MSKKNFIVLALFQVYDPGFFTRPKPFAFFLGRQETDEDGPAVLKSCSETERADARTPVVVVVW